jgi:lambda repressor-like predicted transcriptional regulator
MEIIRVHTADEIGAGLSGALSRKGWSFEKLAGEAGVGFSCVRNLFSGNCQFAQTRNVARVAGALGVSLDVLVFDGGHLEGEEATEGAEETEGARCAGSAVASQPCLDAGECNGDALGVGAAVGVARDAREAV